jgi:hypothetical protein
MLRPSLRARGRRDSRTARKCSPGERAPEFVLQQSRVTASVFVPDREALVRVVRILPAEGASRE